MKKYEKYNSKEWLYQHYIEKNMSLNDIAVLIGSNITTVARWIKNFEIVKDVNLQREAAKNTNLKRYGVENIFQSKDIREKIKKTNLNKYGAEYLIQSEFIQKKISETCRERYGDEHFLKSKDIIRRRQKTMVEKWGAKTTFESPQLKERIKETNLKRRGFEYIGSDPSVREKINKTFIERYGSHPMQSKEFVTKLVKSRGGSIIDGYSAYSYARKHNFPSSNLSNLLKSQIPELELKSLINSWTKETNLTDIEALAGELSCVDRFNKIIGSYRPDFKINNDLYLNVDGLYWHSEIFKSKKYHFEMRKYFEDNDKFIVQIRQDELVEKFNIVKSIIENKANLTDKKIYARNCKIKFISNNEAKDFLNNNHLMGFLSSKYIALAYRGEIVTILSFKIKAGLLKVDRFCSKIGCVVIGGFSKLLKYLEENLKFSSIHYWADLRYGTGNYLKRHGFTHARDTLGWKWTDARSKTFNRLKCRANMDERGLTQAQYAEELGWYKIYDAGQRLWIKDYT